MKEQFSEVEIEVILLANVDIITVSDPNAPVEEEDEL